MTTRYAYDVPESELVELDLAGTTFTMFPMSGLDWRDFIKAMAQAEPIDEAAKVRQDAEHADLVFGIFETHMEPEEYARFCDFSRRRGVKINLLLQIIRDVVEGSAERPTEPPSPSEPGRPTTGDGSTADASSPASTSSGSE